MAIWGDWLLNQPANRRQASTSAAQRHDQSPTVVALGAASPRPWDRRARYHRLVRRQLSSALLDLAAAGLAAADSMTSVVGRASRRAMTRPASVAPWKTQRAAARRCACCLSLPAGNRRR